MATTTITRIVRAVIGIFSLLRFPRREYAMKRVADMTCPQNLYHSLC